MPVEAEARRRAPAFVSSCRVQIVAGGASVCVSAACVRSASGASRCVRCIVVANV